MHLRALLILGFLGALCPVAPVSADDKAPPAQRQAVAKSVSETGAILRRESPAKPWQSVSENEALHTGDLLVAGSNAVVDANNGAVRLLLMGDAGGTASLPIIESAIVLHSDPDVDLDFALLRGRVDLVNRKTKGEAKVRVRGRDGAAEIRLLEPGARVALILSGRWPPGVSFRKDAKPEEHKPAQAFTVLVLQGEIDIRTAKHQFTMHAPPGPALLEGDDIGDTDPSPRRLDKLPAWAAETADTEDVKKVKSGQARFRDLAKQKSIAEALELLLKSDSQVDRRIAVAWLGATDDLDGLALILTNARTPDLWQNSVAVIRHWIGREPGQDQKLYRALLDKHKLMAAQAETVLQLLHNFSDEALTQPETYEGLLDLMASDQLAIRGLAHWHLYRLVPAGRKIGYDPLAAPEKQAQAVQQWRKLIPAGKLPPSNQG